MEKIYIQPTYIIIMNKRLQEIWNEIKERQTTRKLIAIYKMARGKILNEK